MKHLLSSTAFFIVNKKLAKKIGLKATIVLADLISKEQYFIENEQLTNGWFFNTEENIKRDTTLSVYQIRKAIKILKSFNVLEVERKGIPARQFFKIIEEQVIKLLNDSTDNCSTSINKTKEIIIKNNNYLQRRQFFEDLVYQITDISTDIKKEFCDYWTEPNKRQTKMRFEMQKTWDLNRRISTWCRNEKKFNNKRSTNKINSNLNVLKNVKERLKNL